MKKNAYTFAELFLALIVIMIISGTCISHFKTSMDNKQLRFFAYATITNLIKGNISVMQDNSSSLDGADITSGSDTLDWLCVNMADAFSLKGTANCKKTATDGDINFTMANGVAIYGLASDWIQEDDLSYKYKNILMDINGQTAPNRLWGDRIPLRLFNGGQYTGIVQPVNCGSEDYMPTSKTGNSHCKENGVMKDKAFLLDDKIITYDIYKAESKETNAKAKMVASSLAPLVADCKAYASKGLYSSQRDTLCKDKDDNDIEILEQCDTTAEGSDGIECFTLLHRPAMGAGMILDSLIGNEIQGI